MKRTTHEFETPAAIIFRSWPALGLSAILWLAPVLGATAATKTWDGSASGNWSSGANWVGGVAPADGDSLVFPATASHKTTTNNVLGGLSLASIRFEGSGYIVRGAAIDVSSVQSVNETGVNNVYVGLTIQGTVVNNVYVASPDAILYLHGAVHLNGYGLYIGGPGIVHFSGVIDGTGIVVQNGPGTVYMDGSSPNTYDGGTSVKEGILFLNKPAGVVSVPGTLSIGNESGPDTVRLLTDDQIATNAAVYVRNDGVLDLNGQSNTVASLTFMNGGTVTTGTGCLELGGDVTTTSTNALATINGRLHLGDETRTFSINGPEDGRGLVINANLSGGSKILWPGIRLAGLIKVGTGEMVLAGANTYGGHTTVDEGGLTVSSDTGLGGTLSGTTVNSNAFLWLDGASIGEETLTLNPTAGAASLRAGLVSAWGGDIVLNTNASIFGYGTLTLNGQIRGTGDLTLGDPWYPGATFVMGGSTSNLYTGVTWLRSGTLVLAKSVQWGTVPGDLIIGDDLGIADADVVRLQGNAQIDYASDVTIASSGLFDLNGHGTYVDALAGTGHVDLNESVLTVGADFGSSVFDGTITGANGLLRKLGHGTLTLTGTNPYTGTNRVSEGRLIVNGQQPNSAVVVDDTPNHPGLGGTGTVGNVFIEGGPLTPGTSPGILTCSNLLMYGTATLSAELNGTSAGTFYDQLKVRGTVALANPVLEVTPGFLPTEGNRFTILNNETANPITGSFAGLPEGALVSSGPLQFRISYVGGSGGNDVVLTFTNAAVQAAGVSVAGAGNGNGILDPNECNYLRVVVTNGSGVAMNGVVATLTPATPGVAVTCPTSAYPDIAAGGRGTNLEPFQFTTWPGLPCGTNVELALKVETATHGNFTLPVTLWSGSAGTPVTNYLITPGLSLGGLDFSTTILVTDFPSLVAKVTVSVYLSHTNDANIDLLLSGPDGTETPLSLGNGGHGNDYGTNCSPWAALTTFDDSARIAIADGVAPFAGAFRPDGDLSVFRGLSGNGQWHLRIRSRTASPLTGVQHCWMLKLYPAACPDGGGICESCPDRTIYGLISALSASQNRRLLMNGDYSQCEAKPKLCPGLAGSGPLRYDAYTFINGESNACITVSMTSRGELFSAAYLDSYNPADLCENFRADRGDGTFDAPFLPYSFEVPANARFVVVVNEVEPGTTAPYTLAVTGGSCRPVLHIDRAGTDTVALDWTTAAAGYRLEQTNVLANPPHPAWEPSPSVPTVISSRFTVTNTTAGDTDRFYRLLKP